MHYIPEEPVCKYNNCQDQNPVGILSCCIFPDTNAVIGVEVVVEQHTNAVIGVEVVVEQHTLILFLTTTLFIQ